MIWPGKRLKFSLCGLICPSIPLGVAARLLNVHPRTLRIYETEGLINPAQRGSRRIFSTNDVKWIECLRSMIHNEGISIPGLKKLLTLIPCRKFAKTVRRVLTGLFLEACTRGGK